MTDASRTEPLSRSASPILDTTVAAKGSAATRRTGKNQACATFLRPTGGVPDACQNGRAVAGTHGHSAGIWPARPQVGVDAGHQARGTKIFQAGHAGSIPVARSTHSEPRPANRPHPRCPCRRPLARLLTLGASPEAFSAAHSKGRPRTETLSPWSKFGAAL